MVKSNFKPVDPKQDFVEMEKRLLDNWYGKGIVQKYLKKNQNSKKKFSFLDGPITANNPMGVHHAWGRTYKDLIQRFQNMQDSAGRFQNGFDEQGLWVEVEVEKELGFKNKKDIEKFGIDKFVNLCKERVKKYSAIQTQQSMRLGYFMDWDNSYHTSSDANNYKIWNFLKVCHQKGYLYKGRDSVPWCPRCGTAISQHEILTEEYKELEHDSIFFKLPIKNKPKEYLLVWTTTPWTIPANIAVAVNSKENYIAYKSGDQTLWFMEKRLKYLKEVKVIDEQTTGESLKKLKGSELIGWEYEAPFDQIPLVENTLKGYTHRVIDGKDIVTEEEGTGLLHVAPGAGEEDFKLGLENKLPVVAPIEEDASYKKEMGELAQKNAKFDPQIIIDFLTSKNSGEFLAKVLKYKHRYPTCWRCKTELVWRVVDEWYIAMDKKDPDDKKGRTLREEMQDVAKTVSWIPKFGLERELDWLKNMHDWLISKKRYWGLALPIWECKKCGNFEVIGSKEELKEKAIEGWDKYEGNSPHRPWVDNVKVKCSKCSQITSRIPDVGNPWLDAGIVPFSTMSKDWFPADFITESFPGQFKNWFYSLIAMSTVLENKMPSKTILGFATLLDEKGEEMHKSKGNAIEFNEAADKIGVDVMRWMYSTQNPTNNLLFGYHNADEVRRRFYLILWNVYSFFVTYANIEGSKPQVGNGQVQPSHVLDKWIISKLNRLILFVTQSLESYDMAKAAQAIEDFTVADLSTWYIRRSRDRIKDALLTIYLVLVDLSKLIAPFMPFIAEEIFTNLTGNESVHLENFPKSDKKLINQNLEEEMARVREIVEKAHAARKEAQIKVRQPLPKLHYGGKALPKTLEIVVADEINVKEVVNAKVLKLDTQITPQLKAEGEARDIIRAVQQARKEAGCALNETITLKLPSWPEEFEQQIKKETLSQKLEKGDLLEIVRS